MNISFAAAVVGDGEQAKDLLEKMRLRGCKPDGGSFAALIAALHAGGQWQHALQMLDRMQVRLPLALLAGGGQDTSPAAGLTRRRDIGVTRCSLRLWVGAWQQ